MSTHPNVALMQAGYHAYSTGDVAALNDHVRDDFVFISRAAIRSPATTSAWTQ